MPVLTGTLGVVLLIVVGVLWLLFRFAAFRMRRETVETTKLVAEWVVLAVVIVLTIGVIAYRARLASP
jgi:hypothetical protein